MSDAVERLTAALADRYRIEHELGAGGMATVYLAEDLKHDRKVAVKVLKPELAAVLGAERFVAEIKTTASLQHPHILPLHDSGEANGFLYYVMPFIDGETLRDKLNRETQLGVDEAVKIATEIAEALEYAHEHGVIHRDIKPENILLQKGRPMIADFGIALAVSAAAGGRMTETGLSLGTPHYMSPEQATAEKDLTHRSDIYSLSSVLYEMLTGVPPHVAGTAQQIIMKIVTETAAPVTEMRKSVPPNVASAVAKGLEKLPADRFQSAKSFADALTNASFAVMSGAPASASSGDRRWRRVALGLSLALVATGGVAALGWMRGSPPGVVRRFVITLEGSQAGLSSYGSALISPDGTRILYQNSEGALVLRSIDALEARLVPGGEEAWAPVFSPNSRSIAFSTGFPGALEILPLDGGAARTLVADSTFGVGVAWSEDGWIYFLQGDGYGRDLMRIRASGGPAEFIARPDSAANDLFFYWPQVLPGGRGILLTVYPRTGDARIGLLDVASGRVTPLAAGVLAQYVPPGYLVVAQADGSLIAARFDASRGTVRGEFRTMASKLLLGQDAAQAMSISDEGTLIYAAAAEPNEVVRVTRGGRQEAIAMEQPGDFGTMALSRDGSRLAISVLRGGRSELWVKTLPEGAMTRLFLGATTSYRPNWSPDGRTVVFSSDQGGKLTTWSVPADGSSPPTPLLPGVRQTVDEAEYANDGQWLVLRTGVGGGRDILAMRPGVDTSAQRVVATEAEEFSPALSPDGRWLAYGSDESGRIEVYVRPFPNAGDARYTVSHSGGTEPRWSHAGTELFFRDEAQNMVAVEVMTGAEFRVGSERTLFSTREFVTDNRHHAYAISPDDSTFYFIRESTSPGDAAQIIITLNWFEELKQMVGR